MCKINISKKITDFGKSDIQRIEYKNYREPLPLTSTLGVYCEEKLIFCSSGKWLLPLFEFENFMKSYNGSRENLCVHDSAIGKAAAVLMLRQGVKYIHGDIVSKLAVDFIKKINSKSRRKSSKSLITITYNTLVDRIKCATEDQLAPFTDLEQMYSLIKERLSLSLN